MFLLFWFCACKVNTNFPKKRLKNDFNSIVTPV